MLSVTYVLHNNLRVARAEKRLSQSELADMVDVTRQTIAAIEKGDYAPSVTLALRITLALNTPFNELFWLKETSYENN